MNKLKEKYYIALGNLQNMAINNTKGSKGVDICVLDINEYVAYLQSKIDKVNKIIDENKDLDEWLHIPAWNLQDILKEDK